jgi:hypothetical protein
MVASNDIIIIFISRFTKPIYWVTITETSLTLKTFAEIFVTVYMQLHELTDIIISDTSRDTWFYSHF